MSPLQSTDFLNALALAPAYSDGPVQIGQLSAAEEVEAKISRPYTALQYDQLPRQLTRRLPVHSRVLRVIVEVAGMDPQQLDRELESRPGKFTVESTFGSRQWRSRKRRPCDRCRQRKTACVIPSGPPCDFCKQRGLSCEASLANTPRRRPGRQGSTRSTEVSARLAEQYEDCVHSNDSAISPPTDSASTTWDDGTSVLPSPIVPSAPSSSTTPRARQLLTLEGNDGKTAHYMGPASEQDGFLLDTFRSAIINDQDEVDANIIQVYRGAYSHDHAPIHFLLLENEFPIYTNQSMQNASDRIEALVDPFGPDLVRLYFHHVHPVYPILSKTRFLRQYTTARTTALPASLRGAVYALACVFWNDRPGVNTPLAFQQHELVALAYESLRRELEAPNLVKLQACLLLLHIQPPDVDSVETPSTWTSTSQATACAQMIGLHRDPEAWNIPPWEKALRKKLWWAVFATDAWSSVCHGNPLHVHASSFDTAPLQMDHLRIDEDVPEDLVHFVEPENVRFQSAVAVRYLEAIRISQSLHELLTCAFQIQPTRELSTNIKSKELRLQAVRLQLQDWHDLLPRCLGTEAGKTSRPNDNNPLHISYYATEVLLWRALMHPATAKARADDSSSLQQWFAIALAEFEDFVNFFADLDITCLHGFIPRHARSQLILCGNFLIYLFLLARKPADVRKAYQLLEGFQGSLLRLEATSSSRTVLFLKPVTFRINSFFSQAADIMRQKCASPAT